jgi:predicted pyridoxine 5'-phosphate oxidase superfamily flavin-nucleotide-binding protein
MGERPFHFGERQAQLRAGLEVLPGGGGIREFMPDQHRTFFAQLPFLAVATLEADGAPAASLLAGPPGFVRSPDAWTLEIQATTGDPAGERLAAGAAIGLLGIELATRRRNRANGRIHGRSPDGFTVEVEQSFGNCPQHIHPREVQLVEAPVGAVEPFAGLDAAARAAVGAADTFFVATSSGAGVANGGVDISHRGGSPGFVRIDGAVLTIPDFRGNRYFNTLGNLLLEPRAALLFVDFDTGVLTQLQGRAEILWDLNEARGGAAGAERSWRFTVERGWRRPSGLRAGAMEPKARLSPA